MAAAAALLFEGYTCDLQIVEVVWHDSSRVREEVTHKAKSYIPDPPLNPFLLNHMYQYPRLVLSLEFQHV